MSDPHVTTGTIDPDDQEPRDAEYSLVPREEPKEPRLPGQLGEMGMLTAQDIMRAEVAVEAVKKVKALALRVTNLRDWTTMGGKAYLTESGVKKIAALFGISLLDAKMEERDRRKSDGSLLREFTATVTAEFKGRRVQEVGNANSDDDFFRYRGKGEHRYELPFDERDLRSIKKKAVTNALNRATKAILGLNGVLWEEVQAALGKEQAAGVAAVDYGSKPAAAPPPKATPAQGGQENIREKLWNLALEIGQGDERQAEELIKAASTFQGERGPVSFSDPFKATIKDGWIGKTYAKLKGYRQSGQGREPGSEG